MSPLKITSAANPLIKLLKGLNAKKGRAESGLFLAEGARLASEAAALDIWPAYLAFSSAALERPQVRKLLAEAEQRGVRCIETTPALMEQISKRENAQTVIGAYRPFTKPLEALKGEMLIALEGVRDPGNLGTVLRTADCVGAGGVILVGQSCDPYSVEAVRASMGSIFAMPLARVEFDELLSFRSARGYRLVGASLHGAAPGDGDPGRTILLMGNEQSGLTAEMEGACDELVRLPMRGRADSLNVAMAAGVLMYDLWRRRGYDGANV